LKDPVTVEEFEQVNCEISEKRVRWGSYPFEDSIRFSIAVPGPKKHLLLGTVANKFNPNNHRVLAEGNLQFGQEFVREEMEKSDATWDQKIIALDSVLTHYELAKENLRAYRRDCHKEMMIRIGKNKEFHKRLKTAVKRQSRNYDRMLRSARKADDEMDRQLDKIVSHNKKLREEIRSNNKNPLHDIDPPESFRRGSISTLALNNSRIILQEDSMNFMKDSINRFSSIIHPNYYSNLQKIRKKVFNQLYDYDLIAQVNLDLLHFFRWDWKSQLDTAFVLASGLIRLSKRYMDSVQRVHRAHIRGSRRDFRDGQKEVSKRYKLILRLLKKNYRTGRNSISTLERYTVFQEEWKTYNRMLTFQNRFEIERIRTEKGQLDNEKRAYNKFFRGNRKLLSWLGWNYDKYSEYYHAFKYKEVRRANDRIDGINLLIVEVRDIKENCKKQLRLEEEKLNRKTPPVLVKRRP